MKRLSSGIAFAASVLMLGLAGEAAAATVQCTSITGGGTKVSSVLAGTCPGCSIADADKAIDGNLNTFATITVPAAVEGGFSLRATAQRGIAFAAGSKPGAVVRITKATSAAVETRGIVRSYLGNAAQNEKEFGSSVLGINIVGSESGTFVLPATKTFNAVEYAVEGSFTEYFVQVFEFCSDTKKR